jgi:hypothetical protein
MSGANTLPASTRQASEQRESYRKRTLFRGRLVSAGETYTQDCVIRDMTEAGARVAVQNWAIIPDRVTLIEPRRFVAYDASVKWRRGKLLGLCFDRIVSLEDETNPRIRILKRLANELRGE